MFPFLLLATLLRAIHERIQRYFVIEYAFWTPKYDTANKIIRKTRNYVKYVMKIIHSYFFSSRNWHEF